jgi:uncharacterized protein (TIGR02453 family)
MNNRFIIDFLQDLSENNNREWFNANKERYVLAADFFKREVIELIAKIGEFDSDIKRVMPESCIFRIYRDIRFSPDKTPYKTHFGAYIAANGGRKSVLGGYYVHIKPKESFLSGGIYWTEKESLKKIRHEIEDNFEELQAILNEKSFKKNFGDMKAFEKNSRLPLGFSANSPAAKYLIFKHFLVEHTITEKTVCSENFIDYAVDIFHSMKNFNRFFNEIIFATPPSEPRF